MGENTTLKTSAGEVEIRNSVSAGEYRKIRALYLEKVGTDGEKVKGSVMTELEDEVLKITIVSVGGETEDVIKKINDLPVKEFQMVWAESEKAVSLTEEKKTS